MDSPWKSIGIMETETGLFYAFSTKLLQKLGTLNVKHQLQVVDIIENYIENNYKLIQTSKIINRAGVCLGKQPLFFKVKIKIHVPKILDPFIKIKSISIISSDEYLDMYNDNKLL